ncbi:MAG: ATP-dependent DNA ligase [Conexivisphaerales archaeon]
MSQDGSFSELAEKLEQVSRTSSKNEKVRILAEYFSSLNSDDLASVCRFILGKESEAGDVGVGFSVIWDSLTEIIRVTPEEVSSMYLRYGDMGEVMKELLEKKQRASSLYSEKLKIDEVQKAMDEMAIARGKGSSEMKKKILKGLLLRAEPLEAKYLVRILTNELRIGATEGIVLDAVAKAFDVNDVRQWYLVIGDIGEVAKRAASGEKKMPEPLLMRPVSFMLALPVADEDEAWEHFRKPVYAEYKYDGIRLQAHVDGKEVRLFSRRMEDVTLTMPEIAESLSSGGFKGCIFDGEAVAWKDDRPVPFTQLQKRLHRKNLDEAILREIPIAYFVFDLLKYDDAELLTSPLMKRKGILEKIDFKPPIRKAETFSVNSGEDIASLFRRSRELGYEGLVLKDPDSQYTPGRRGGAWVKMKEELDTLDVVVVKAEYGNGKRAGLLSDLTFAVWDGDVLKPIGKAYSGLTDQEIIDMTKLLQSIAERNVWNGLIVRPQVVLEVAFDSIQKSSRHSSGYALRFPRIKRVRWDKSARDADRIERVIEIYRSQISTR